ncbi:MAG: insulinase family protein [Opitutaceae bacterium]|nr:insulinase family protein [Opitutaceae bacterium]
MNLFRTPFLLLFFAFALGAADAPAPELPPRVKAPTDQAQFRRFILGNGMKVLLVSDPKFNKSSAALVIPIGAGDDPADREGMAHFLEHMLFLGTEKYPDVNAYGNFMQTNGGYNNAYTASDHTNYQFEVRHEALAEGLDRLAQFFIAPLFTPEFTGREINAVHNEAMRHVQNDGRRRFLVAAGLYAPGSPESKFGTGNKDTLAGATPAQVRAFYEATYSADQMALAICGKAPLDELEKLAREKFGPVPKRAITPPVREARFLPRKAALRLAQVEPIKEERALSLEFAVPGTRADFASKPDELLTQLISYPGPGGLVEALKRDGLINGLSAFVWERTPVYGSLFIGADLTPAGKEQRARVLTEIFAYLAHLRAAPFPADFYRDRARIAALNETYRDRGEGASLATTLANQALFYPLEVAERAGDVWGAPDEAAYRRLLNALTADNALVMLSAKGVPTDKKERIYGTAYSYNEETGAAYDAIANPVSKNKFTLPGANRFMPRDTPLLAERPVALINEPGLVLHYAPDTEFQRPQTAFSLRFVPVREMGTARAAALLRLYDACLRDFLTPATSDAELAGLDLASDFTLEGAKFSAGGYGDSAARYVAHVAENLKAFTLAPGRFEAIKEAVLRSLRSYSQTEAYVLARDRRDALMREVHFLPSELIGITEASGWGDVQAFAKSFFARGAVEAVVHGHFSADQAIAATRLLAQKIGAQPAQPTELLRRRHVAIAPGENIVDAGPIEGVNSAFIGDYVIGEDAPALRVAAAVAANFFGDPFFSELRTKQQLGYIVGSNAGASLRHRYFTFVIQSSGYAPEELRRRAEAFIATLPAALAAIPDEKWATLIAGARSQFEEKPKNIRDKAEIFFGRAYTFGGEWDRQQASLAALASLTQQQAADLLAKALAPETARRRTVLLGSKNHPLDTMTKPAFTERELWKPSRRYQ